MILAAACVIACALCAVAGYYIGRRRALLCGWARGMVHGSYETARQLVPIIYRLGGERAMHELRTMGYRDDGRPN